MELKDNFQYFLDHQDDLVSEYPNKVIAIKDQQILGAYDTEIEAFLETKKNHEEGTFIIQRCLPGEEAYTSCCFTHEIAAY